MKSLKQYLFNNDKLNIGFFFLLIFFFFLITVLLLIQYETFIYQKYTGLYKQQTIYHLSYDVTQILKSDISDAAKLNFCYSLAETYLKDENIKEIWITDNELRLFFSTDPNLMQQYHSQKLPAFYYPLYEKPFSMRNNEFLPRINNSLDKYNAYITLPVKIRQASSFDYTIGLKIRKKHFWMEKNPVVLFSEGWQLPFAKGKTKQQAKPVVWNYSIWILYLIFIFIALFFAFIFTVLMSSLYSLIIANIQRITDKIKNLEDYSDVNTVKLEETDNALFRNFVIALNNLIQHILFKKNEECGQHEKNEITAAEKKIVSNVNSHLFPSPSVPIHGFRHGLFYSNKNIAARLIAQLRNIDSFRASFLITETKQSDTASLLTEYNYIYHAFHEAADAKLICSSLNNSIFSLSGSQLSGAAGYIDTTNNFLTLYPSGLSLIFFYKASTNSVTSDFHKEPLMGILPKEDYELKLHEEKIKMDTNDILLIFNEDVLTEQLTIENLKEKILENADHDPDSIINYLSDFIKSKNIEDLFLFILKKK